jgi:hypothetical protein
MLELHYNSEFNPRSRQILKFLANFQEALIFWFFCIKAKERMIDFKMKPVITALCPISLGGQVYQ